jgi:NDP-sugar pyrophosphorylase family protein
MNSVRERVTITIKNELLRALDGFVDGESIRNRSHAIEFLLSQSLLKKTIKVLILAGGKSVNFPHLSADLPKAMLPVGGKPLLEHTVERLKQAGLTNIIISLGQHGRKISDYFRNGQRFGVKISYAQQMGRSGTAQPLKQAEAEMKGGIFLLLYGDVLAEIDYQDLIEYHKSQIGLEATMAVTSVEKVSEWGVARMMGSKIVEFEEKPFHPKTHSHLVNSGVYVINPQVFNLIGKQDFKLESSLLPRLAEEGRLGGYIFEGNWHDISNQEAYLEAIREYKDK